MADPEGGKGLENAGAASGGASPAGPVPASGGEKGAIGGSGTAGGAGSPDSSAGPAADGEKELGFLEHLGELRSRIIRGLCAVIPAVLISYELSDAILSFLSAPLKAALPPGRGLIATALPDTFLVHVKIALWGGVFLSSPFWLYQLWAFVAPGLYRSERRSALKLTAAAVSLMAGGAAFAYLVVIPAGFSFFVGFGGEEVTVLPAIDGYLSLVMTLLLAFGAAFQLPLLLMFLAAVGLVDSSRLSRFRRFAVVIIVALSAFLTPPDVVSQILMSIPLILLYELSLFLIRGRERAAARTALEGEGGGAQDGGGGSGSEGPGAGGRAGGGKGARREAGKEE
jgi:sec-independent protein translocase protein TatC